MDLENTLTPPDANVVLEVREVTKRFPGILANDRINLKLRRGEILALLGENGAGKSTLMNIIYGLYHQDEGQVFLKGREVKFASPREAIHSGIGMVHQHFQLVDVMTVAENVVLGEEKEAPNRRSLFWIFFIALFGIGTIWLLGQNSLVYDIIAFVAVVGALPLLLPEIFLKRWQIGGPKLKRFSRRLYACVEVLNTILNIFSELLKSLRISYPHLRTIFQALAALFFIFGVADGGSGQVLLVSLLGVATGLAVGFGAATVLTPRLTQNNDDAATRQSVWWQIFGSAALIVYGIWFLVLRADIADGIAVVGITSLTILAAAAGAAVLAFVFSFLFNHWEAVTGVLRVVWGAAGRLGLIIVAFWIGAQVLRISQMAIITVILQHEPTFYAEPDEDTPVGNVNGKAGFLGTYEYSVSWRRIEQAGNRELQSNALLDEIDENYGVEYTYENTHDGLTSRTFVTGTAGYNTLWRDAVEDVPPVLRDILVAGLLLVFAYVSLTTWRGAKPFPGTLNIVDLAVMLAISGIFVWRLNVALEDVSRNAQTLLTIVGAVIIAAIYAWTYRNRQKLTTRPMFALDGIIEGLATIFYDAFSVRDTRESARRVRELSKQYGLEVDPDAVLEELPVGAQQRVEIVKALYRKADILILDEPTAVLTPQEGRELFKIMRELSAQGVSIIFITHKLKEVFEVASDIVVMRGGKVVGTTTPAKATESSLAAMMVGREVLLRVEKTDAKPREVVLHAEKLEAFDDRGAVALNGVGFEVREGEVLGIAGVQGNGQTELVEVITGLRPLVNGSVELLGEKLRSITPRRVKNMQTGHVPEDRLRYGLVKPFSVAENLVLDDYYEAPYSEPPTPIQLPILGAFYGVIFAAIFAVLGYGWLYLWEESLWTGLLDRYDVPVEYRTVPTARALNAIEQGYLNDPILVALISLLITTFVFSIVAHVGASTIMGLLRKVLVGRQLVHEKNGLILNREGTIQHAQQLIAQYDIRTPSPFTEGGSLSGGNQQKLVVAREFSRKPRLLIAAQPTRGIDVGSIEFIHKQIIAQRDEGAAVLLVSAELDEVMSLADRIAVMYKGQIIETLDAKTATREQLGLLMAGIKRDAPTPALTATD